MAYRVDFGITRLRSCFVDENLKVAQAEPPESSPFADKMRLICLQMPAFTKTEGACVTDLDNMDVSYEQHGKARTYLLGRSG